MVSTSFLLGLGLFAVATKGQSIWFQPGVQVTRFLSTMIVPPFPVEASGGPSYHALWPGLQPTDNSFVYQNVLDDFYPSQTNIRWDVSSWYGPSNTAGAYVQYQTYPVTVGDSITTDYQYHVISGTWTQTQIIEPGKGGTTAGESPSSASFNVAFKNFPNNAASLTQAVFVIELQGQATWNFGPLTFTNIVITANTTSTTWCTSPYYSGSFTHSMSSPVATVVNGQSQCYIAQLTFLAPKAGSASLALGGISGVGSGKAFNVTHAPAQLR